MQPDVGPGFQPGQASALKGRTYTNAMRVAAIIPAYNEARSIAAVGNGVRGVVERVIVVDDGSSDGTTGRARAGGGDGSAHRGQPGQRTAVRGAPPPLA